MSRVAAQYVVEPAKAEDLGQLPVVELLAASLFGPQDVPERVRRMVTSAADFAAALRESRLWVARAAGGEAVGFAYGSVVDQAAHLAELDVLPEHGRRGLGSALVRVVQQWAEEGGFQRLTLNTFRHLPFNAPFYARLGFRELAWAELTPAIAGIVRREVELGFDADKRCVMALELSSSTASAPVRFVSKAGLGDVALNELFAASWPAHRARDFTRLLAHSRSFVSAHVGPRLIGFVNLAWDGGEHGFLLDPTVHPEFRRRGIGSALVGHAVAAARDYGLAWLHVDYEQELAGFYQRAGFRPSAAGVLRL